MKSIKPGRGTSAMGLVGSIFAVIFGIFWTMSAASMGAPGMFPVFGLIFIGVGVAQAVIHYKNARGENRMSLYDITDEDEEGDMFEGLKPSRKTKTASHSKQFCPYCGDKLDSNYRYCPSCGQDIQ